MRHTLFEDLVEFEIPARATPTVVEADDDDDEDDDTSLLAMMYA